MPRSNAERAAALKTDIGRALAAFDSLTTGVHTTTTTSPLYRQQRSRLETRLEKLVDEYLPTKAES